MDGLGFAPMGFWLSMLISMLVIKLLMGYLGFKLGTSVIETLSDKIGKISSAANIVGVTVIAALATSFVKANIAIKYSHNVESGEKQVIAIQDYAQNASSHFNYFSFLFDQEKKMEHVSIINFFYL